jgi:hypothetical protein
MKNSIRSIFILAAFASPAVALAQANQQPVTRAEVRAELRQIEQAGYNPTRSDKLYPADVEAANARIAAAHGTATGNPGVGGTSDGVTQ